MKTLPILVITALLVNGAMAGPPPPPQVGIFFSPGGQSLQLLDPEPYTVHPQSILDVTPFVPFRINVAAYYLPLWSVLQGYRLGVVLPDMPGWSIGEWDHGGDGTSIVGSHPYVPESYTISHIWSEPKPIVAHFEVLMFMDVTPTSNIEHLEFLVGPFDETSLFPELFIDDQSIPCEAGPDYSDSDDGRDQYGYRVSASTIGIVATEVATWSSIKSLFR